MRHPSRTAHVHVTRVTSRITAPLSLNLSRYCLNGCMSRYRPGPPLTGFRRLSSNHDLISNRALEGSSNSNICEIISRVSTSFRTFPTDLNFRPFSIPSRNTESALNMLSTLLIQMSLPKSNNNVFTSVI